MQDSYGNQWNTQTIERKLEDGRWQVATVIEIPNLERFLLSTISVSPEHRMMAWGKYETALFHWRDRPKPVYSNPIVGRLYAEQDAARSGHDEMLEDFMQNEEARQFVEKRIAEIEAHEAGE